MTTNVFLIDLLGFIVVTALVTTNPAMAFIHKYIPKVSKIIPKINIKVEQSTECGGNGNPSTNQRWCIPKDYHATEAPSEQHITKVYATVLYTNLIDVIENEKKIEVNIHAQLWWEDDRIKTSNTKESLSLPYWVIKEEIIWKPSILVNDVIKIESSYFGEGAQNIYTSLKLLNTNQLQTKANSPFQENVTIVEAWFDVKITILCKFDYTNYPMDTQTCKFRFGSFPLHQNYQLLLYDPEGKHHFSHTNFDSLGFDITTTFVDSHLMNENQTVEVGFDMVMNRIRQPFIYQYYLPCTAIVLVSQLSFVVPLSAIPGRIALAVTQFLALTNVYIYQMVVDIICIFQYQPS